MDRRERQLAGQRAGLIKLQTLHQSVEANHYIVIHHLGQQLVQVRELFIRNNNLNCLTQSGTPTKRLGLGWVVDYSILVSALGPLVLYWDLNGVGPMGFRD